MAIEDYSGTAGSNTTVGGVSIAEGMSPAGVNNAMRALMADIANSRPDERVVFLDDFLAGAIEARISSTAGSGTGNQAATVVANSVCGEITLTTASDDGSNAANSTLLTLDQLNWKANQGGLEMWTRVKISDVSEAALFVGFTDTISTTVELPIFMLAADIDSDATDACGLIYDVDATTDRFTQGGVKAGTDTAPTIHGSLAPTDGTYFLVRVVVSATGGVLCYVDGTAIGAEVANAVTITTALTPCIAISNRSANQVVATVDFILVLMNR